MKNLLFILMAIAISMSACKKGDTGPEGPAGEAGPAGKDGSVILAGTAAPQASDGNEGDYYLDKTNSLLYGPKTSSGWGTGLSLKGSTGATGAAGSQIHEGDSVPDEAFGSTGDYYLDTTNYLLYGPKLSIVILGQKKWGAGLQLGAPMQTYLFTTPYDYISSATTGSLRIPFDDFHFTDDLAKNSLALVYLKRNDTWHLANGPVGYITVWFDARYNFSEIENYLYIYLRETDGTNWTNLAAFESGTSLQALKIVVVPPAKVSNISSMLDKSYEKVMEVLSQD